MQKLRLTGRSLNLTLHGVVWVVLFVVPAYLLYGGTERDLRFLEEVWFQFAAYAVLFYASYLFLAPSLFFRGKKWGYALAMAVIIVVFTLLFGTVRERFFPIFHPHNMAEKHMDEPSHKEFGPQGPGPMRGNHQPPPARNWPLLNFFLTSCMITGLSLGLRFSEKLIENEKIRKEAEKQRLDSELALLKHQINPHFLFNTLNSIYSLALARSELTAEAVMKLSDMMRYVIQEAAHETVLLSLEIEYIRQYVELQKIRLSDNVAVTLSVDGNPENEKIPPMLLVPFIENAFKHGTSTHKPATIGISIAIDQAKLSFTVVNRIFPGREKPETFGMGLSNTRKRLELAYPGKHLLELKEEGEFYRVRLEIELA